MSIETEQLGGLQSREEMPRSDISKEQKEHLLKKIEALERLPEYNELGMKPEELELMRADRTTTERLEMAKDLPDYIQITKKILVMRSEMSDKLKARVGEMVGRYKPEVWKNTNDSSL